MTDIVAEVSGWVADEIGRQALGEEYAHAVTLGQAAMQAPQGVMPVPQFMLLITTRNPLLGEGPLFHGPVPVGFPRPGEQFVRAQVAEGLRLLRQLASSKLAGGNGKAPARLTR